MFVREWLVAFEWITQGSIPLTRLQQQKRKQGPHVSRLSPFLKSILYSHSVCVCSRSRFPSQTSQKSQRVIHLQHQSACSMLYSSVPNLTNHATFCSSRTEANKTLLRHTGY